MCKIANIDRSNFYKWLKTYNPSKYKTYDDALKEIFAKVDKTYGYRRLHNEMVLLGFRNNEKFLRKRMKQLNLVCEIRQKKKFEKSKTTNNCKCKNYLNQKFKPNSPNSCYSVDMTYLNTCVGTVYLNVIIDLFNKMPVAYLSSYSCDSKLAEDTIDILARKRRKLRNAIIHSDQGSAYLSKSYINKLIELKAIRSNSKKGYPYDNACSENFFSIFKVEKFNRLKYIPKDKNEIDEIVNEYIDFYINARISSTLDYLTPQQYYDKYIEGKKILAKKS